MNDCIKIMVLALFLILSSCANRNGQEETLQTRPLPKVTLPSMIQDPYEAAEYMAMHYWDAFLQPYEGQENAVRYRCDSLHVAGVTMGDFEQGLANYIHILESLPLKTAQKAVARVADIAQACETADTSSNVFETFVQMAEKYLFDPNSPLRNEDLYSPFTEKLSRSAHLYEATRDRYAYVTEMCRLNEKGTKAADFRFCDKSGRMHTLYGITAEYTLLFFSNPGCQSCLEIINILKAEPVVAQMVAEGRLAVLNIYIDEDLQGWKEYMPVYPEEWYNGFDPDLVIRTERIYNVRAIPSLYLLDSGKTVLLKDAVPEKVLSEILK